MEDKRGTVLIVSLAIAHRLQHTPNCSPARVLGKGEKPMEHHLEQLRQETLHLTQQVEHTLAETGFLHRQLQQTLYRVCLQHDRLCLTLERAGLLMETLKRFW